VGEEPPAFLQFYDAAEVHGPADGVARLQASPYQWRDPASIPVRDWLYGRQILRGHVHATIAPGAGGKTTLKVGTALSLATGRDLLGKTVWGGPKRVWLWNLEDSAEEMARSIQGACKHWGISKADLEGRLFLDTALDGARFCIATSTSSHGLIINRPLVEDLTRELTDRKIDLFSLDPLVSAHGVNENDNMEIDAVVKEFAAVAHASGTAIDLSHHTSKSGATETTALGARGAVALINACRSVLTINRMNPEEADRFGIEGEERRRFFRVYDDKNNRAPPAENSDWYRLISVDLENGGLAGSDSVGVVVPWAAPKPFDGLTGDHLLRVQMAVAEGQWRDHHSADDWVGNAVAKALGLNVERKSDRSRILELLRTWKKEGALKAIDGKDDRRKPVKFVVVGRWQNDNGAPVTQVERSAPV
jgi:hypothetical protein